MWSDPKFWAGLAAGISVAAWVPMWVKALHTRSTRDYATGTFVAIVIIELLQLRMAWLTADPLWIAYMAGKTILATASLGLVLYFSRSR